MSQSLMACFRSMRGAALLAFLLALFFSGGATSAFAQEAGDTHASKDTVISLGAARLQAERILTDLARHEDPFVRANAMEAVEHAGQIAVPLLQLALEDEHPAVRFAALTTIGKRKEKAMQAAIERRLGDDNASVRAAALYALVRIGKTPDLSPLAQMLGSQSATQRSNAALLLGLLGDASAVPMLKELARVPLPRASPERETIVRIQIAEALVRMGDLESLQPLQAGLFSQFDEVRVLSAQILGRLKDHSMNAALRTLLDQNPVELRIAAAESLGHLGELAALPVVLKESQSDIPTARSQAALALSVFPVAQSQRRLVQLLQDPSVRVRVAAAAGILRLKR